MANYGGWRATITDAAGNVMPLAKIEVRGTDGTYAAVFADRGGVVSLGQPFFADAEGFVEFYAPGGVYEIKATLNGEERVWRDVAIGTAQALDIDQILLREGGEMEGPLVLAADPDEDLDAATKGYVDQAVDALMDYTDAGDAQTKPGFSARRATANIAVTAANTPVLVNFDTVEYGSGVAGGIFTVPAGQGGRWRFDVAVRLFSTSGNARTGTILLGKGATLPTTATALAERSTLINSAVAATVTLTKILDLVAGDIIQIAALFSTAGTDNRVEFGPNGRSTEFFGQKL